MPCIRKTLYYKEPKIKIMDIFDFVPWLKDILEMRRECIIAYGPRIHEFEVHYSPNFDKVKNQTTISAVMVHPVLLDEGETVPLYLCKPDPIVELIPILYKDPKEQVWQTMLVTKRGRILDGSVTYSNWKLASAKQNCSRDKFHNSRISGVRCKSVSNSKSSTGGGGSKKEG